MYETLYRNQNTTFQQRGIHTMHQFAFCSISRSTWARAYYDRRRERGDGHNTALRKLAHQWIRIIVALIRTGQPYDEARYLARSQARSRERERAEKRQNKKRRNRP